jgi:hypothetical protein
MNRSVSSESREVLRSLRFISECKAVQADQFGKNVEERLLLTGLPASSRKMVCAKRTLSELQTAELITLNDRRWSLTTLGVKRLKRAHALGRDGSEFQQQHRQVVEESAIVRGERLTVRRNCNESPLARLRARKNGDGRSWLSDGAYGAGERLRRDFTLAQLMHNVSSNWDVSLAGSHKPGGCSSGPDLSASALDARKRFNRAMEFVGPDLAGVLTDVCCYLKGLVTVEREQRWPARSAKLLLRTGLGLLVRYYGTEAGVRSQA